MLRAPGCVLLLVLGSFGPFSVEGFRLRSSARTALFRQAPVAPPEGKSERAPAACSCDFCISKKKVNPSEVSPMKCTTPLTFSPDTECKEDGDVIRDAPQGVPYIKFCQCSCQAISEKEDQQCIALSKSERQAAKGADGQCQDPGVQTVETVKKYEDAQAAAAAAAADAAARKSFKEALTTPKQKEQLANLKNTLADAKNGLAKIKTALGNAEMALAKR